MTYATKYPRTVKDIPVDTKFIVLINGSYHESGYDPGDSGTTVNYVQVLTFSDEATLREWVTSETAPKQWSSTVTDPKNICILPYARLNIEIETKIKF